jgi:hypothetical protein
MSNVYNEYQSVPLAAKHGFSQEECSGHFLKLPMYKPGMALRDPGC